MGDEIKELFKEGDGCSCDISLKNTPTSHPVSLALAHLRSDSGMLFCHEFAYAITANGDCLYLLVPPLAHAVLLFDASVLAQLHVLNRWAREKSTLCNNLIH